MSVSRPIALLIPLLLLGASSGYEFQPPKDYEPGSAWSEDYRWHSTGHTIVKVGGVKVRDKERDEGVQYSADLRLQSLVDGQADRFRVVFGDASTWEDGKTRDLGLAGVEVESTGLGDDQRFERVGKGRLSRKVRRFLEDEFGESEPHPPDPEEEEEEEEEEPGPFDLLLPEGPIEVGQSWSIDLDLLEQWLDPEQFQLDREQTTTRVELLEVVQRDGERVGRFTYEAVVVPAMVKDVEFSVARMAVTGTAELAASGAPEHVSFDVEFAIRFVGRVEWKGVKADIDMTSSSKGRVSRSPLR